MIALVLAAFAADPVIFSGPVEPVELPEVPPLHIRPDECLTVPIKLGQVIPSTVMAPDRKARCEGHVIGDAIASSLVFYRGAYPAAIKAVRDQEATREEERAHANEKFAEAHAAAEENARIIRANKRTSTVRMIGVGVGAILVGAGGGILVSELR